MKENETKALELSEEELAQVSGGGLVTGSHGTADDGNCGQTVDLDVGGKCTAPIISQCNGCRYSLAPSINEH